MKKKVWPVSDWIKMAGAENTSENLVNYHFNRVVERGHVILVKDDGIIDMPSRGLRIRTQPW